MDNNISDLFKYEIRMEQIANGCKVYSITGTVPAITDLDIKKVILQKAKEENIPFGTISIEIVWEKLDGEYLYYDHDSAVCIIGKKYLSCDIYFD